jgi:hypothetical protein
VRQLEPQIDMTRKEPLNVILYIVKVPRVQNKKRILKASGEKFQVTYKG